MPVRLPPLTDRASRILLESLIDFAGLFPPAELSMTAAVRQFAHYRASGAGWMLGRFVCPVNALEAFSDAADPLLPRDDRAIPWRLSVTARGDAAGACEAIAAFNERHRVCFEECGAVVDMLELPVSSVEEIAQIDAVVPRDLQVYCELPFGDELDTLVRAVAHSGRRAKMRTGGVTRAAFPTAESIAQFLRVCHQHEVPAKATAGLHHPLCGDYRLTYAADAAHGPMFGFLNVLLAAALVRQRDTTDDLHELIALLDDRDPTHFHVDDLQVAWTGPYDTITFDRATLHHLRTNSLVSIGSCSFTEPVDEARALGWIPAAGAP
jgi:hypothetical protein